MGVDQVSKHDHSSDTKGGDVIRATDLQSKSGTVDGKQLAGIGTTADATPGFGTWTQISADRPALLKIQARCETDGTADGRLLLEIDESGGTSADYSLIIVNAGANLGSGGEAENSLVEILQPGAQYQIVNQVDPNNANSIDDVREGVL